MKYLKKSIILLFGIVLLAIGTVINTRTHFGNTATGALAYTIYKVFNGITLGNATNLVYFVYILIEIVLIKKVKLKTILQFPATICFGYIIDILDKLIKLNCSNYYMSALFLLISIICISLGMMLMVKANIVLNAPDGIVKTMSKKFKLKVGISKNIFDIIIVIMAALLGYIATNSIIGIGIGTIISSLCIGRLAPLWEKVIDDTLK